MFTTSVNVIAETSMSSARSGYFEEMPPEPFSTNIVAEEDHGVRSTSDFEPGSSEGQRTP